MGKRRDPWQSRPWLRGIGIAAVRWEVSSRQALWARSSSDVDFVAVSKHRPDGAELQGLAAVHAMVRDRCPGLDFEGTHLTWSDLVAGPMGCAPAPFHHDGKFEPAGFFAINPVTWHELAGHGLALRGPPVAGTPSWRDETVLRAWSLGNLVEYWRPWTTQYRNGPSSLDGDDAMVCWGVLGVSRLHYTINTGRITSKTGAGQSARRRLHARQVRAHRLQEAFRETQ
jgi:hypothetical protein